MKTKIIALKKRLQAILYPHQSQEARQRAAAEYLIISQPNSGRTWLRVMIGNIFQELSGWNNIDSHNISYFAELSPKLPYIKAVHERFKNPADYQNKKIILLVRDPRDSVISNYFLKIHRDKDKKWLGKSLSEFIRESSYIDDFIDLCNAWKKYRDIPKAFLLLQYEKNKINTEQELKKVTNFLGLQVGSSSIQKAVNLASFENMRDKEINRISQNQQTQDINQASLKMRKGKVSNYQDRLSSEDIEFIENKLHHQLDPSYGYNYFSPMIQN